MSGQRKVKLVRPGEGRAVNVVGDTYRFLAVGGDTDRSYMLMETEVPPGGGPPPHYHRREEEGFYILEGEFEFRAEGEVIRVGRGTFLNLPKESRHAFRNIGTTTGRMLVLCAPAGIESFFVAADRKGPEDLLRLAEAAGITILPPED